MVQNIIIHLFDMEYKQVKLLVVVTRQSMEAENLFPKWHNMA